MLQIVLLMLAQDLGPPGDEPVQPRAALTRPRQCARGAEDDIVVCGAGLESQRVEPLPAWLSTPVFKPAEARLSPNKTIGLHAEQGENPFSTSPRAMISFKLDF